MLVKLLVKGRVITGFVFIDNIVFTGCPTIIIYTYLYMFYFYWYIRL